MSTAIAIATKARRSIPEDTHLHYWGEFFVQAGLYPFLRFDEFVRDPEAFVNALCNASAPAPKSMPGLHARIKAHVRWNRSGAARRVLIEGETR